VHTHFAVGRRLKSFFLLHGLTPVHDFRRFLTRSFVNAFVGKCNLLIYWVKMLVTVHFGVEHSKNLNRPGARGYFIKLATRRQSVAACFLGFWVFVVEMWLGWLSGRSGSRQLHVCPHLSARLWLDGLSWNLVVDTFVKVCLQMRDFVKIGQNTGHLTGRPNYI
jgi:hypothetical protein